MDTRNKSKAVQLDQDTKLKTGVVAIVGKSGKIRVQGKEVKVTDFVDAVDALSAATAATAAAQAVYRAAVAEESAVRKRVGPLVSGVRAQLRTSLSDEELAACGLTSKRRKRSLSAEERVAATAKNRATRHANHTQGAQQRRLEKAKAVIAAAYAPSAPAATSPPAGEPEGLAVVPGAPAGNGVTR